jgi:hypothetical protein
VSMALSCPRCGRRRAVEPRQADFGIRCSACDEFMDVDRSRPPGPGRAPEDVRPWTPWQVAAASVLFGAVVGGAVAGFNFARLGKRQYLIPSVVAGPVLLVVAAALLVFLVPDEGAGPSGLLANLGIGVGFLLVQKPFFDAWKAENWRPSPGERYRPNGLGQLLVVSLVSLGLEFGVLMTLGIVAASW